MDSNDRFLTIEDVATGIYKEKGSKFIAYAHPVSSPDLVKPIIDKYKKDYHDARHHCYSYKTGVKEPYYRMNDDGEPSGTAGKPIYGQILSNNLTDILIVVIRYFGGTLLGVSGLIKAYKNAAIEAINNANIIEKTIQNQLTVYFEYPSMNNVLGILKNYDAIILENNFEISCNTVFLIRESKTKEITGKLNELENVKCEPEIIDN